MTCPNCGLDNQQGAYCKNCGQFLDRTASEREQTTAETEPTIESPQASTPSVAPSLPKTNKAGLSQETIKEEPKTEIPSSAPNDSKPAAETSQAKVVSDPANKEFLTVWLLSVLVGFIGVDRFYVGKIGTGVLKLLTWGGYGLWTLIDIIFVLTGQTKDKQGNPLNSTPQQRKLAAWLTVPLIFAELFIFLIFLGISASTGNN